MISVISLAPARLIERKVIGRQVWATVLLVVIVSLTAGAAMAAAAGGRRAATSYDRFVEWSGDPEVGVRIGMAADSSEEAAARFAQVAALPAVAASSTGVELGDEFAIDGEVLPFRTLIGYASDLADPNGGNVKLLAGRMPDNAVVGEAAIGFETAERLGLDVGDSVEVRFVAHDDIPGSTASVEPVTIVGIAAFTGSFPSVTSQPEPTLILTSAFQSAHADRVDWTNGTLQVRLVDGSPSGTATFLEELDRSGIVIGGAGSIYDGVSGVRRLVRVEAGVLWLSSLIIAVGTAVVIVQFLRRQSVSAAGEIRMLGVFGGSRSTLATAAAWHGLRVGTMSAVGAIVVAVAVSGAFPRGVARIADPHVGLHADMVVLAIGFVAIVAFTMIVSVATVALESRSQAKARRRSLTLGRLSERLPPAPAAGVRLALAPNPTRPGGTLRLGLMGLVVLLAAVIAVASMGTSFDRVLARPELSGNVWDLTAAFDQLEDADRAADIARSDPAVAGVARGGWGALVVDDQPIAAVFIAPGGELEVATDRGRAPLAGDEIALGVADLEQLGLSVGDVVTVGLPDTPATVDATVTGRSIVAAPFYLSLEPGRGGVVSSELVARLLGEAPPANTLMLALVDGNADLRGSTSAVVDRIEPNFWFARADRAGVRSLRDVHQVPNVMVWLLGLMAATALLHRIVMGSRSGRPQQAVLRTLGFTSSQSLQAGASQGAAVALLGLAGALPLGILGALVGWRRVADYLIVLPDPVLPVAAIAVVAGVAIMVAVAAGLVVAVATNRARVTDLLRVE